MAKEKEAPKKLSRREFVRGAAAGAAAVAGAGALASCAPAATPSAAPEAAPAPTCPPAAECAPWVDPGLPDKWDKEADVVVVGYGGAGGTAAISAHDAGAKVLVLEKMPAGGGTTNLTGGWLSPTNVDDFEKYVNGLFELSSSEIDTEMNRVYAEEVVKNYDWVTGLKEGTIAAPYGYAGYPEVPGSESVVKYSVDATEEEAFIHPGSLTAVLEYAVEERGIEVLLETPGKRLIANCEGEVVGVIAESNGQEMAIKAKRGVVLTTGGHANNPTLLQNHAMGAPIYFFGNPGNTGDGTMMAQAVGARLWHMNGLSCPLGIKVPEFEAGFMYGAPTPGYVLVDQHAKRFVNEKGVDGHAWILAVNYYDDETLSYPRIPCYLIVDETSIQAGPLGRVMGWNAGKYTWSADNSAEIEKGWIKQGSTIAELAGKLGLDAATLEETIAKWNEAVKTGVDTQLGRPMELAEEERPAYIGRELPILSAPIESPPYYAVELHPCLLNTQGGPKRNAKAQIEDAFGMPIPRLYSAGELGTLWGFIYQGAGNIGDCLAFGRIAGTNAAAEKPWA